MLLSGELARTSAADTRGISRVFAVGLLIFAHLCGSAIYAQETWGTVRGTVTDPSGAAVPGAKVELSGALIPRSFSTETDATGLFQFSQIPLDPGTGSP